MRRFVLIAALLAGMSLSACATFAGRHQYVSIDSEPRGLEVHDLDDDGELLGTTPLFLDLKRKHHHHYELRSPTGETVEAPMDCAYRWRGAFLANVPLGALGYLGGPVSAGLVFGLGNSIDLISGAAWACPERMHVAAQNVGWKPPAAPCPVLAVAPPEAGDEKVSELVAERWEAHLQAAGACATFADRKEAKRVLQHAGVSHEHGLDVSRIDPERLNELGFASGATHVEVLEVSEKDDVLTVTPARIDLHSLAKEAEPPFTIDLAKEPEMPRSTFLTVLARYLRFLPNSLAFSASSKVFAFTGANGSTLLSDAPTPSWLPSLLSNWTVGWVEHPSAHGEWDATFSLSPTIEAGYNARSLTLSDGADRPTRTLEADIVHGIALYDANVTFHTPLGAFSFAAGVGGGGAWLWENDRFHGWTFRAYANAEADYTAFVTERLFFQLGVAAYQSRTPHVVGSGYTLTQFQQASLTLGWYLPEMRSAARNLF